jgi:hypothetical protein
MELRVWTQTAGNSRRHSLKGARAAALVPERSLAAALATHWQALFHSRARAARNNNRPAVTSTKQQTGNKPCTQARGGNVLQHVAASLLALPVPLPMTSASAAPGAGAHSAVAASLHHHAGPVRLGLGLGVWLQVELEVAAALPRPSESSMTAYRAVGRRNRSHGNGPAAHPVVQPGVSEQPGLGSAGSIVCRSRALPAYRRSRRTLAAQTGPAVSMARQACPCANGSVGELTPIPPAFRPAVRTGRSLSTDAAAARRLRARPPFLGPDGAEAPPPVALPSQVDPATARGIA